MIRELLGFSICRFNPVLDIRQALERQLEAEAIEMNAEHDDGSVALPVCWLPRAPPCSLACFVLTA